MRARTVGAGILLAVCFLAYVGNLRFVGSNDSRPASLLPFNLLRGDGLFLDRLVVTDPLASYGFQKSKAGRWMSSYPIATPILVTPLYLPTLFIPALALEGPNSEVARLGMEKMSAAVIAASSVAILFLVLTRLTRVAIAGGLAMLYAFGSSTWVISSQSLYQHGMANLLLAVALLLLLEESPGGGQLALLGSVAALLGANRPSDVVFSAALGIIVLKRWSRRSAPFFAAAAIVGGAFVFYNLHFFGHLLGGYAAIGNVRASQLILASAVWQGLAGLLFSNVGLLVYCPFFLWLLRPAVLRNERLPGIRILLVAWVVNLLLLGTSSFWYTGYGPRFLTDGLPILFVALVEPVERLATRRSRVFFGAAAAWAVALQAVGAFCYDRRLHLYGRHTAWSLEAADPVVSIRAGLARPDFLPTILPRFTPRNPLTPGEDRYTSDWSAPPPGEWPAGETKTVAVTFDNVATAAWTSLPGWLGKWGVGIAGHWIPSGEGGAPIAAFRTSWLAWRLEPGGSVTRSIALRAPNRLGRQDLCVGLEQTATGSLVSADPRRSCAAVNVTPGRLRGVEYAEEWESVSGPSELAQGQETLYSIRVRNVGHATWRDKIHLAYHWNLMDGTGVVSDGMRTSLDGVGEGAEAAVSARVLANVPPGTYRLTFDIVAEGIRWFERPYENGTLDLAVNVR